ncbi:hypothetical protein Patl1_19255 [Pistacia atlantica]|uniref:Uncharacterized protein n=1 Tax=Pistacia atlantica TaxID=434234 RepID=A0ACC1C1N5_9ROSI|nr:hypothetical protein Patl1_19255 [Pistacia atlantica]
MWETSNALNSIYNYRKLYLYPNGSDNEEANISIGLRLAYMSSLSSGWEINAIINCFEFNQLQDKYVAKQGTFRVIMSYHNLPQNFQTSGVNLAMPE